MNFTLHQLRVFQKICETGSITKAAKELYLTQPAVSIQLKNLQDQFDIPLTELIGRKIHVTDFGRQIAEAASNILKEVETINYQTMIHKGLLAGKLRISVVSTGKYVMPYFLTEFLQQHDGVELAMDVTNKSQVVESLENNEVDFALVSILPEHLELDSVSLMPNMLYLVGSQVPPNAKADGPNNFQLLNDIQLIYRENGSGTRFTMENFLKANGLSTKKQLELTSNEAVKQAVLAGLGYSIMPLIGIRNELKNGTLKIIPVKGLPLQTNWHLTWLKQKRLSPVATAFVNYLETNKDEIIRSKFEALAV
ncbi:MAG: LysR family transcriptional regulator [Flavobacteriales bacterium]|nr:LysR family transcriptional regulator [Flavobacteriales bacterium]